MKMSLTKKLAVAAILASALVLTMLGGCAKEPEEPTILRYATSAFRNEVFDPIITSGVVEYERLLYLFLVGLANDGSSPDTRTGLAYKWEANADNTVWTFYLREDAIWQDGTPITAQDVKFSLPRVWADKSLVGQAELFRDLLGGDEEVDERIEIIDDHTVRLHLTASEFAFPLHIANNWGALVPKHYVEQYGEDALSKGEMQAGPYKLAKHVAGSLIRLEAWREHPFLQATYDVVELMEVAEESTRLAMLKTGEIDITQLSYDRLTEMKAAGFDIIDKPSGTMWAIEFIAPHRDPVLANPEVRKAIMMAIDKDAFNAGFLYGGGIPTNDGGNVNQYGFDPRVNRDPIPYDLEAAKEIIARVVPKDYVLHMHAIIRGPVEVRHNEAVMGMLEKAGFTMEMELWDYGSFKPKLVNGLVEPAIWLKNGRFRGTIYYPTYYAASPEGGGTYMVIDIDLDTHEILSDVEVHPDIPWEHLKTLRSMDDIIFGKMKGAQSFDEFMEAYSELMDRAIEQIAPGSGFLFSPTPFAVRPGILPEWDVDMGAQQDIHLAQLAIYPPEYEDEKYHPEEWEGKR